jgi:ABC-type lipoprotein release transport system permease subunit
MWESAWLALLGLGAGGLLTLGPYLKLSRQGVDLSSMTGGGSTAIAGVGFDPVFRVGIFPETFAFIVGAVFVSTMAAGLYPAWKAGRVEPVETIKLI